MELVERVSLMKDDDFIGRYAEEMWIKNVLEAWEKKNVSMKTKLTEYMHAVELEQISLLLAQGELKEAEVAAYRVSWCLFIDSNVAMTLAWDVTEHQLGTFCSLRQGSRTSMLCRLGFDGIGRACVFDGEE